MKRKTAMMKLSESLYNNRHKIKNTQDVIRLIQDIDDLFIPKEKEQIMEGFKNGRLPVLLNQELTAEQFYNETYKQD